MYSNFVILSARSATTTSTDLFIIDQSFFDEAKCSSIVFILNAG